MHGKTQPGMARAGNLLQVVGVNKNQYKQYTHKQNIFCEYHCITCTRSQRHISHYIWCSFGKFQRNVQVGQVMHGVSDLQSALRAFWSTLSVDSGIACETRCGFLPRLKHKYCSAGSTGRGPRPKLTEINRSTVTYYVKEEDSHPLTLTTASRRAGVHSPSLVTGAS